MGDRFRFREGRQRRERRERRERRQLGEWKRQRQEVFVPLVYKPGDLGEVDFFEVFADVGDERRKAWMFVLRLMHSGRDFAWLYPRQDQACFLDGHVRAFSQFGAVPQRLLYDNLKPAVTKVLVGNERQLAAPFTAMGAHYIFEPCFARPRTGHDKGGVEARGLRKAYGDLLLMDDVNFTLPPGGIVGVIGPNGAGKTTLFRMITGQEQPDGGSLRLGDTVKVAYVDQSRDALAADKSVWDEVTGGNDEVELGKRKVASRAYVSWFNFKGRDQQRKVGSIGDCPSGVQRFDGVRVNLHAAHLPALFCKRREPLIPHSLKRRSDENNFVFETPWFEASA